MGDLKSELQFVDSCLWNYPVGLILCEVPEIFKRRRLGETVGFSFCPLGCCCSMFEV